MATVTIQKRKRNKGVRYLVSYKIPMTGKKKHYKTFCKYREAQQAANDLRSILDSGNLPDPKRTRLNVMSFNQAAKSLETEWKTRHDRKELSSKTVKDYCIWLRVINQRFGDKLLCGISKEAIISYRDEIIETRTNVTANKHLSIIKKVFTHGISLNAVRLDPSAEIPYLSEKGQQRNRFLLPNELENLFRATQHTRAKFYLPAIISIGIEYGGSKQEIVDLEWSKIDFAFQGIGLINLFRTKNTRERTEFLMPRTKKALLNWKAHLEHMRYRRKITEIKSNHVFCRLDGTPIKCFNKAWWHSLKIAGITNFHFHDLRHTFCSNLLLSGADIKDVKEMIGHSDIGMTDRYTHLTTQRHLQNQRNLSKHYTGVDIG